ncbi:MAG: hypothetical protein DRH23_13495 [Deltaproteobacteria bacterium]|nr:hypothetical protein [Deltaproteobacteria bacterium]MBW2224621.1 hypothetical protein [Deltaproteobacteria bacterium]MBW2404836.1 hypothetical protein [Deltaproteobacteria bacterium]MBW2718986.1 hypothetical protein [Deltaproteobacteria bacterium]RLB45939.1 MAG: hypothetical protein DRH23_13495 [Deltaproteobacteria bacterium]
MRVVRAVFYVEVITNLGSAIFALLFPAAFLGQFTSEPLPVAAVEFGRWYAVLLVVLSLVLWVALREGTDRFLRPVIAAYFLGDALQVAVAIRLGLATGAFTFAIHAAMWTSVLYACARIYYLVGSRPR